MLKSKRKGNPGRASQSNLSWGNKAEYSGRVRQIKVQDKDAWREHYRFAESTSRIQQSTDQHMLVRKLLLFGSCVSLAADVVGDWYGWGRSPTEQPCYNSDGHYSLQSPENIPVGTVLHNFTAPLPNLAPTPFVSQVLITNNLGACAHTHTPFAKLNLKPLCLLTLISELYFLITCD